MGVWRYSPRDSIMLTLSIGQYAATILMAAYWEHVDFAARSIIFTMLVGMIVYNIVVISHLFTHTPWFSSAFLNRLVSVLNSINIGQSVQVYQFMHVRNHHRYNNDRKGPDGTVKDLSSTYRDGIDGEHSHVLRYAFLGALWTLVNVGKTLCAVTRLYRVGNHEQELLALAAKAPARRSRELAQIRLDRIAYASALALFLFISWKWTLCCYLPAFYLALAIVNVQNYYEHYGAAPTNRYTDSVSYYGKLYNLMTFNDGYHQEHHLRPQAHWTRMPLVRDEHCKQLQQVPRIVSPVPAVFGFLHLTRECLHRRSDSAETARQKAQERRIESACATTEVPLGSTLSPVTRD